MGKLSRTATVPRKATGVIRTRSTTKPDTLSKGTGRPAFARDVKSELFTLAVSNFVGEDTFYEAAGDRDERFRALIAQATTEDPAWTAKLLTWLRTDGNMRSASIVGAIEYGRAYSAAGFLHGIPESTPRAVLSSVMQRADEPGEALGYWLGQYGRPVPKWLKKGLGDGADNLYNEFSAFKYDGGDQPVRFGDVIEYSQVPGDSELWKWLLARRHNRERNDYQEKTLKLLAARRKLDAMPVDKRRAFLASDGATDRLREAGYTWEALSGWIQGPLDASVWEAVIPNMGYMALLRNLRNFDESGISKAAAKAVEERLTDPAQVAKSRQLPFRFLSAYKVVPSDRWKHALGEALDLSFANVPQLKGKTLVLIDTSGSMGAQMSARSTVQRWEIAALFGIALAKSQADGATIVGFDHSQYPFEARKGANVLSDLQRFERLVRGGATYTQQAVDRYQAGHQRIVVVTDEQQNGSWGRQVGGVFSKVPDTTHCYTINVAGYADSHAPATGVRHGLAGLNDSVFKMMGVLEARKAGAWPWNIA